MLGRIFKPAALLAVGLAALLSIGLACRDGAEQNVPRESEQSVISQQASPEPQSVGEVISDHVTIGYARWPTLFAQSMATMREAHDMVVVGRVTQVTPERVPLDPGPEGTPPANQPKSEAPTPPPNLSSLRSIYSVEVIRVIDAPNVRIGETMTVVQDGGVVEGVAYELEGDPVIERGTTYLFFLREGSPGTFFGAPFGRFVVDAGGKLQPMDEAWAYLPAVRELSGLTVDEAAAVIEAAVAEAAAAP